MNPTKESVAGADIRQRVEDYAKAISAKDIEAVMSFFAPDVVSFDIAIKTLGYVGADGKRREWQKAFAAYSSIAYDVRDLNVTMDGELALIHAVNHVSVPADLEHGQAVLDLTS
jgi:ketosteroid isomerase-like protein